MLGVGASDAHHSANTNALIEGPRGRVLLDCGYTAPAMLHARGLGLGDIAEIVITHCHADHVFGLERFAFDALVRGYRPVLHLMPALRERLWGRCLSGVLDPVAEGPTRLETFFEVHEIASASFVAGGLVWEPFEVRHTPKMPAYGFRIEKSITYTGDTLPIGDTLRTFHSEVVLHDCQVGRTNPVHADLDSIIDAYMPDLLRRIWAVAYEDGFERHEQRANRAGVRLARTSDVFPIAFAVPDDGLTALDCLIGGPGTRVGRLVDRARRGDEAAMLRCEALSESVRFANGDSDAGVVLREVERRIRDRLPDG